jgi:hypothetical protein
MGILPPFYSSCQQGFFAALLSVGAFARSITQAIETNKPGSLDLERVWVDAQTQHGTRLTVPGPDQWQIHCLTGQQRNKFQPVSGRQSLISYGT